MVAQREMFGSMTSLLNRIRFNENIVGDEGSRLQATDSGPRARSFFDDLPAELVLKVLHKLPKDDLLPYRLLRLQGINKKFHTLINDPSLWQQSDLSFVDPGMLPFDLLKDDAYAHGVSDIVCRVKEGLKDLDLDPAKFKDKKELLTLLMQCPNLESVEFLAGINDKRHRRFKMPSPRTIARLTEEVHRAATGTLPPAPIQLYQWHNCTTVYFRDLKLRVEDVLQFCQLTPNMKGLTISSSKIIPTYWITQVPFLANPVDLTIEDVKLDDFDLMQLLISFPNMVALEMYALKGLTDVALIAVLEFCNAPEDRIWIEDMAFSHEFLEAFANEMPHTNLVNIDETVEDDLDIDDMLSD